MITLPLCLVCRHFHHLPGRTCDAFPEGVPDEVFLRKIEHRQPVPGDHGIQFEKATVAELEALAAQRIAEGYHPAEERDREDWERARREGQVTGEYQPPQRT
jgi:hypothetical protein